MYHLSIDACSSASRVFSIPIVCEWIVRCIPPQCAACWRPYFHRHVRRCILFERVHFQPSLVTVRVCMCVWWTATVTHIHNSGHTHKQVYSVQSIDNRDRIVVLCAKCYVSCVWANVWPHLALAERHCACLHKWNSMEIHPSVVEFWYMISIIHIVCVHIYVIYIRLCVHYTYTTIIINKLRRERSKWATLSYVCPVLDLTFIRLHRCSVATSKNTHRARTIVYLIKNRKI